MFIKFLRSRRGSILPAFAIAALPLVAATGAAVDFTRAFEQRAVVQGALDSAVLAAGKKIGLLTAAQVKAEANNFYLSNIGDKLVPPTLSTSVAASTITATTDLRVPTYFLGIVGLDVINFHMLSSATLAMGTLEVAMVLDNSGSMAGTKISTLQTAAKNLTNTLFGLAATSTKPDPIKVALVPFAGSVNVGSNYQTDASATWLDKTGIGTYNQDALGGPSSTKHGFALLSTMKNTSWGGCVEERPMPFDVSDDIPTSSNKSTLFVSMVAPDEPDNWTCPGNSGCSTKGNGSQKAYSGAPTGSQSYNNYLTDNGGTCSGTTDTKYTGGNQATESTAFQRLCKYGSSSSKVTPASITVGGIPGGPNFMCTTAALTPLSTSQSGIISSINGMIASGSTNIQQGLMWGWRLLSADSPFSQGRAYTVNDNQKILILMTDGENTYYPQTNSTLLKSWYGAWGFIADNHLGTTSTSSSTIVDKMNVRTALACANAKAAKIKIYTVAFTVTDPDTLQMLTNCASDPSMAYQSSSTSDLLAAFSAIGDNITLLRVAR